MTYIVLDNCIKCKYTDCVVVCPVDCFHEGENMLVIDPDSCIDCGVCEPECPIGAIVPESEAVIDWLELNRHYAKRWPVLTELLEPMEDAESFANLPNKKEQFFSELPGTAEKKCKSGR